MYFFKLELCSKVDISSQYLTSCRQCSDHSQSEYQADMFHEKLINSAS